MSSLYPSFSHTSHRFLLTIWVSLFYSALLSLTFGQVNKLTSTVDGITFDSDYDNGSLRAVFSPSTGNFNLSIYTEPGEIGSRKYWFRFTMDGVSGRSINLNIDHAENPRPFLRILDPTTSSWRRLNALEAPNSNSIILNVVPGIQKIELAFFHPLGVEETFNEVSTMMRSSPYANSRILGTSTQGRNLPLVTVETPRYPNSGKHLVWIHSRAHAGEVTSTHCLLGFLEQILEDSPLGRQLREHCLFDVLPLLNVDGVHLGKTRWDSKGFDLESEWCGIRTPEVEAVKRHVNERMASSNPITLALNLHSTRGNFSDTFFFKHLSPSISPAFEVIQQDYIDAFAAATPLFANGAPQFSQLNACTFIESYFWNNWGESVMALTHEGHFFRRITDNEWITGPDYVALGRAQAAALVTYFDLPATSEPDLSYNDWQDQQFGPGEAAIAALKDDPDQDGINNLAEYAFALDPKQRDSSPLQIAPLSQTPGSSIALTFQTNQHTEDLQFFVEFSSNLTTWTREPLDGSSLNGVIKIVDTQRADGFYVDEYRVPLPESSRFARIVVESNSNPF